jgi:hypothetical protein
MIAAGFVGTTPRFIWTRPLSIPPIYITGEVEGITPTTSLPATIFPEIAWTVIAVPVGTAIEETVAFQVSEEGSIEELPGKSNFKTQEPLAIPVTIVLFITPPLLSHNALELTVQIVGVCEATVRI